MRSQASIALLTLCLSAIPFAGHAQIPITPIDRETPIDFAKEIYPLLKKNCIACHSRSTTKGQLNLETPKDILKGGSEGPSVIPGKPEDSFLLQVAAHQEDPIMPPEKNKANAVPFTSEELGLLQQWIAEGAEGDVLVATPTPETWALAKRHDYPVYHMALGPHDRFVAASRGQRVFLYDIQHLEELGELIDPKLTADETFKAQPPAHHDFVQSLAFSPQGWIASGGFRNVKLWQPKAPTSQVVRTFDEPVSVLAVTLDHTRGAAAGSSGNVHLWDRDGSHQAYQWHEGAVHALAWSPDGKWLATSGADGHVHLISPGKEQPTYSHKPTAPATALHFLHGRLAAGLANGHLVQWAVGDGKELSQTEAHTAPITALASANHSRVYSSSQDGTVKAWEFDNESAVQTLEHGAPIIDLALSPDGTELVSIAADSAKSWKTADGSLLHEWPIDPPGQRALEEQKRAQATAQALLAHRKKKVEEREKLWNDEVAKAKKAAHDRRDALTKHDEAAHAEHAARLAHADHLAALADAQEGLSEAQEQAAALKAEHEATEARMKEQQAEAAPALESLKNAIAEATSKQATLTERLQQLEERRKRLQFMKREAQTARASLQQLQALAKDPDTLTEAITATENVLADTQQELCRQEDLANEAVALQNHLDALRQRETQQQEELHALSQNVFRKSKALGMATAIQEKLAKRVQQLTESGKKLDEATKKAVDALDGTGKALRQAKENEELAIRLTQRAAEALLRAQTAFGLAETQLAKATEIAEAAHPSPPLLGAAWSADGQSLAFIRSDASMLVVNPEAPDVADALQEAAVTDVVAAPTGGWFVTTDKTLKRVEASRGWDWKRTLGTIDDPTRIIDRVTALAFSPDGRLLATGSGSPSRSGQLKIWRVADGSLLHEIEDPHSDTIVSLEFSPDGQHLATASTDRFAKVFDVQEGSLVSAFEGHTGHVLDVSWRADGLVLATAGADKVIKLWDFEEERQLKTIDGYNQEITSVAFADTAEKLVTSSGDKSVRLGGDRLDGKGFVYASALTQDGDVLLAASQDSAVRLWQTRDKKLLKEFTPPQSK